MRIARRKQNGILRDKKIGRAGSPSALLHSRNNRG
jgi:hypothetical protein